MLVLFHIILEIPLLSFTHSARPHRMCPFRMTQRAPCALFLNAPLPLFQAAGNPKWNNIFNSQLCHLSFVVYRHYLTKHTNPNCKQGIQWRHLFSLNHVWKQPQIYHSVINFDCFRAENWYFTDQTFKKNLTPMRAYFHFVTYETTWN